jgi:hypothetical protein
MPQALVPPQETAAQVVPFGRLGTFFWVTLPKHETEPYVSRAQAWYCPMDTDTTA